MHILSNFLAFSYILCRGIYFLLCYVLEIHEEIDQHTWKMNGNSVIVPHHVKIQKNGCTKTCVEVNVQWTLIILSVDGYADGRHNAVRPLLVTSKLRKVNVQIILGHSLMILLLITLVFVSSILVFE